MLYLDTRAGTSKDPVHACYPYRCVTASGGNSAHVQVRGPDGLWQACQVAGRGLLVAGYSGALVCPEAQAVDALCALPPRAWLDSPAGKGHDGLIQYQVKMQVCRKEGERSPSELSVLRFEKASFVPADELS